MKLCLFVDLGLYNDAVELTSRFSEFYKVGVTDQWSTMVLIPVNEEKPYKYGMKLTRYWEQYTLMKCYHILPCKRGTLYIFNYVVSTFDDYGISHI